MKLKLIGFGMFASVIPWGIIGGAISSTFAIIGLGIQFFGLVVLLCAFFVTD